MRESARAGGREEGRETSRRVVSKSESVCVCEREKTRERERALKIENEKMSAHSCAYSRGGGG